jgi:hypothetical protein
MADQPKFGSRPPGVAEPSIRRLLRPHQQRCSAVREPGRAADRVGCRLWAELGVARISERLLFSSKPVAGRRSRSDRRLPNKLLQLSSGGPQSEAAAEPGLRPGSKAAPSAARSGTLGE